MRKGMFPEKYYFNIFPEVILLRDLSARDRLLMKDGQVESLGLMEAGVIFYIFI